MISSDLWIETWPQNSPGSLCYRRSSFFDYGRDRSEQRLGDCIERFYPHFRHVFRYWAGSSPFRYDTRGLSILRK